MSRHGTLDGTDLIDTGHDMILKIFFYSSLSRIHVIAMNIFFSEVIKHRMFAFIHVKKQIWDLKKFP